MDSTAVYDSGNAGDSESWSSSEGEEQVIEISSHSRILISPRKARPSAWDEKLKRTSRRRLSTGKRKVGRAEQIVSESPRSQASRYSVQEPKSGKSCWIRSPRKTPADNQPASSNNRGDISQSESESDESFGSGQKGSEESSSDSDASLEAEWESPVLRRTLRRQRPKVPQKSNRGFNLLAADSIRSLDSSTPGKEMEELKATLKKLAGHDGNHDNPLMEKALNISSATALHEYLTAATALGGVHAADQIRPTEYPGSKPRHKSFNAGSYVSTAPTRTKSTSMLENNSYESGNFGDTTKNPARNDRLTLNKKLFSTPPPPFAGAGKYAAGLAFPVPTSSNPSAGGGSSGAQGSRAVLSALKALQDKIVRLEEERETLKQQLSDTKLTVRKREAELAASEKKFSYELGQTRESARAAYDALRCDREELKLQLVKSEERRKAIQVELQHFQELTKTLSEKTDDLQARLQISESHRSRLKAGSYTATNR
ncbi:unnamed protein product [Phytophthora lilii]|uniref:Unnamed protein product n=1 Tax=Phytophthora lilii TaxID=2077276 RepID=A0A9W6U525_9STRA|nr:unnamed protein product [Phytophthora lilii]